MASILSATIPSHYTVVSSTERNGIMYLGDPVVLTLNKSGANAYEVRNYLGTVVESGSVSGTTIILTSSFDCGWYRVYLTGPNNDASYGHSYGAYAFIVIRSNSLFSSNPGDDPVKALGQGGSEGSDVVLKGALGIGTSRLQILRSDHVDLSNPYWPGFSPGNTYTGESLWNSRQMAEAITRNQPQDPARPFPIMCQFAGNNADTLSPAAVSGTWMLVYPDEPALDPEHLYMTITAGTSSGHKVTIHYPNNSTLVETFDNLGSGASAATTINATSNYIKCFSGSGEQAVPMAQTSFYQAIDGYTINTHKQGVINTVTYLYPYGVHYYEGPQNEPSQTPSTAQAMKLFQGYVHLGNAAAIAMGPCFVAIGDWEAFINADGLDYCDEISTHMYNSQTAGDINMARYQFSHWKAQLEAAGAGDKPIWSTESTGTLNSVYDSYHPRRSRIAMLQTLMLEQFGCPRERNQVWYDSSHGFWGVPSWFINDDGSLNPHAALYRTLAEETFYQLHHHAIDFGSPHANAIFLGSVYKSEQYGNSTAVLVSQSWADDFTVTLTIEGTTDDIVIVDAWGNESSVAQSAGKITVPVYDIPTYVRLPAGVLSYVDHVNDWDSSVPGSVSAYGKGKLHAGTVPNTDILDNTYQRTYGGGGADGSVSSLQDLPDTAQIVWNSTVDVDRVIIIGTSPWQPYSGLIDFDIQTTTNGTDWTTRATVTKDTPTAFIHPTSFQNVGCTYETYHGEQWIYDVPLPATYSCTGVRLYVRETTYGGEPIGAIDAAGFGQGNSGQHMCLQEILVPSATSPTPYTAGYVDLVTGSSGLVGYWRLGEPTGATVAVSAVNSPTLDGSYFFNPDTTGPVRAPGAINDGNTAKLFINLGYVAVADNALLHVGDTFTIEFWHNVSGDTGTPAGGLFDNGQMVIRWEAGTLKLYGPFDLLVAHASVDYTDTQWHHIVITKAGGAPTIYIDSVDVTTVDNSHTFTNTSASWHFGWRVVDEFALYNVAISASDVLDHFNAQGTPSAEPTQDVDLFPTPDPFAYGDEFVGGQAQVYEGDWLNAPNLYAYEWQKSDNGTTGWTSATGTRSDYIIDAGLLGKYLRCRVTPSNVVGAGAVTASNAIGPIGATPDYDDLPTANTPAISVSPVATGTPNVGETISSTTGTWTNTPTSYAYLWQKSSNGTTGWTTTSVTTSTLYVTSPYLTVYLRCQVIATNADGHSAPAFTNVLGPVQDQPELADGSSRRDRRTTGGAKPHGRIRRTV